MTIADMVFLNGKIATVDSNFTFCEAVAVKDGLILATGSNKEISSYISAETKIVDLNGKTMLPATHDSHMHGTSFALNNICVNCGIPASMDLQSLKNNLKIAASKLDEGQWIRGANLNFDLYPPDARPTRYDIDEATGDHPAMILDVTGHGALVNTRALEISGIDKNTPDPDGGYLGRDKNGELTGELIEASAIQLVFRHAPNWSDEEIESGIVSVQKLLVENGYAGYTESTIGPANDYREYGGAGRRVIDIYKKLYNEGKLLTRVSIGYYCGDYGVQSAKSMQRDLDEKPSFAGIDPLWLKMDMTKIFCDGLPAHHSGWLIDDYADRPGYRGKSCLCGDGASDEEQAKELKEMISIAHKNGMQVGVHAIGDRAVKETIDAIISVNQADPRPELRHYVIHGEYHGRPEQAALAGKFGIPYSVQPEVGGYIYENAGAQIGAERGYKSCDLKTPLDNGVVLCAGSDAIAGEFENWRQAIQVAVTRKSVFSGRVFAPELRVTVEDAIRMFTINAAYQEGQEKYRGSIEPGKVADFQVLERDIFTAEHNTIADINVVMTVIDGKVVYDNNAK